jgi:hypothetical protein
MEDDQDQKIIKNVLVRVYEALKFTPDEINGALNDLAGIQQLAMATELLKSLTETEVAELNKDFAVKRELERKVMIERIAKTHASEDDFKARVQSAAKKVLNEHIAYLKTRGDGAQKEAIAKILAEIE